MVTPADVLRLGLTDARATIERLDATTVEVSLWLAWSYVDARGLRMNSKRALYSRRVADRDFPSPAEVLGAMNVAAAHICAAIALAQLEATQPHTRIELPHPVGLP